MDKELFKIATEGLTPDILQSLSEPNSPEDVVKQEQEIRSQFIKEYGMTPEKYSKKQAENLWENFGNTELHR